MSSNRTQPLWVKRILVAELLAELPDSKRRKIIAAAQNESRERKHAATR